MKNQMLQDGQSVIYYALAVNGQVVSRKFTDRTSAENARSTLPAEQQKLAEVVSVDASDPKTPLVKIKVETAVKPVTLAQVKANHLFADSPLVRQGRLSVVPLSAGQFKFLSGE